MRFSLNQSKVFCKKCIALLLIRMMELDEGFNPSGVKEEEMELDEQDDPEMKNCVSFEDTVLVKTEPPNLECKVEPEHLELVFGSNDEDEISVKDCLHHPDEFCYVYGVFMCPAKYRKKSAGRCIPIATCLPFRRMYSDYFGFDIRDQHEPWVPHYACKPCYTRLRNWEQGKSKGLPFGTPRIWSKPSNHVDDCYFCLTVVTKSRGPNIYPDLPSSRPPDYCKVAPGRNRSMHSVELPLESGGPSNATGIKLEEIEQECVLFENSDTVKQEPSQAEQDCENSSIDEPKRTPKTDPVNPTANCKQRPDKFCYICGSYILAKSKYPMNAPKLWRLYAVYFELDVDPPEHPWEPKFSCASCFSRLNAWSNQKGDGLPFGVPRIWSKPSDNHLMDCYFCVVAVHARRQMTFDVDIPSSRAPDYSVKAPGRIENLQAFDDSIAKGVQQELKASKEDPFANCKRHPDDFCYVCGHYIYTTKKHTLISGTKLRAAYKEYFQKEVVQPAHPWEPKFACTNCSTYLYGDKRFLPFVVPRRWAEPTDHDTDCFFCLADSRGMIRGGWSYLDLPSSRAPVPVDADHPRPGLRVVVKQEN